jgi:hypothetical protein
MNSSISASSRWRRVLARYAAGVLGLGALVAAGLLALDPYDSGRFALFGEHGVPQLGERLTHASLGRRGGLDTAIIGNSTLQLIAPARLAAATGRQVVQLAVPGSGPREQLVIAEWFLRHHPGAAFGGLVIGLDTTWCGALELTNPFPFWLYGDSALDYAAGLMSLKTIDMAGRKVKLLLGGAEAARADGYHDFEIGRVWDPAAVARLTARPEGWGAPETSGARPPAPPAAPLLARFLARLPAAARVVLVWPPRHRHDLPPPGSAAAAAERACQAAFAAVAATRPGTTVLDFIGRADMTEDAEFWDLQHYRSPVARRMETEIAAALSLR